MWGKWGARNRLHWRLGDDDDEEDGDGAVTMMVMARMLMLAKSVL